MIAIIAFIVDVTNKSNSPNPEIEKGPKIDTAIPPPTRINPHIPNRNPKRENFKERHPSKMWLLWLKFLKINQD